MSPFYDIELSNGQAWSAVIAPGKLLRFTSHNASPNLTFLLYNAEQPLDRYNMPDTLKGQHISRLQKGSGLHSDMGRLMASIVDSSLDWHDPLCGPCTKDAVYEKYGDHAFHSHYNEAYWNGRDNLLKEVGKHGLGRKDLVPAINLFSKVNVDEDGALIYHSDHGAEGDFVDIRIDMKLLVIASNTPHPLHSGSEYPGGKIQVQVGDAPEVDVENDVCLQSRPENLRGWQNTREMLLLGGLA